MTDVDPVTGKLEAISDAECVRHLHSHDLGRIALVDRGGRPLIFPVNYFFDEGVVVFRTGAGTKLDLAPGALVGFEIDGWDREGGTGWSVLVKGIAHDFTEPRGAPTARIRHWPVKPAAPGSREHWIGIWAKEITGRSFGPATPRSSQGQAWAPNGPTSRWPIPSASAHRGLRLLSGRRGS